MPGLTLGLESFRLESWSVTAEGLGLLVQSCLCIKPLIFQDNQGAEGEGHSTSCIHPQELVPHLLAVAHSLEHLDLDGVLWANGHSYDFMSAKDLETIFILGYGNGGQTLNNQIEETASGSVQDPVEDSSVPIKLYSIEASWFNVDSRFGSFRGFTKLKSLILQVEHLGGNNTEYLPTELVFILPANLEH